MVLILFPYLDEFFNVGSPASVFFFSSENLPIFYSHIFFSFFVCNALFILLCSYSLSFLFFYYHMFINLLGCTFLMFQINFRDLRSLEFTRL